MIAPYVASVAARTTQWVAAAKANRVFRLTGLVAGLVVVLDQVSKMWILHGLELPRRLGGHVDLSPFFDLTYVENRGVSFGLFAGGTSSRVILTLLALSVSAYVLHWAGRLDRKLAACAAGFIVGGALGNAYDRAMYGFVVDFLDISGLHFPWVFNVADMAINVGVALLAYDAFVIMPKREAAQKLTETKES